MASVTDQEGATGPRQKYRVVSVLTSLDDYDCEVAVRSNGKIFYIRMSPSGFHNSPTTESLYRQFVDVLRSGEETEEGVTEDEFYEWLMPLFEPLMAELAIPQESPFMKNGRVTLRDYLYPEWVVCTLEAVDETLIPKRVNAKSSGVMAPEVGLDDSFLRDLETWTTSFDPSEIILSFTNPEDALFENADKVVIDRDGTACFFKRFHPGAMSEAEAELGTYKKIANANLPSNIHICRLNGVVRGREGHLSGMLLTYIDHVPGSKILQYCIWPDTPLASRQKWASQIMESVKALHKEGIIWGDAKAENVLIDKENNAWITDFGGGYTEGWVDREYAGTRAGDLQGLANSLFLIIASREADEPPLEDEEGMVPGDTDSCGLT